MNMFDRFLAVACLFMFVLVMDGCVVKSFNHSSSLEETDKHGLILENQRASDSEIKK